MRRRRPLSVLLGVVVLFVGVIFSLVHLIHDDEPLRGTRDAPTRRPVAPAAPAGPPANLAEAELRYDRIIEPQLTGRLEEIAGVGNVVVTSHVKLERINSPKTRHKHDYRVACDRLSVVVDKATPEERASAVKHTVHAFTGAHSCDTFNFSVADIPD